jgi:hypothetical protein
VTSDVEIEPYSEVRVAFILTDPALEPEEVTSLLHLQPANTWKLGDPIKEGLPLRYKHGGWQVDSGLPKSSSFEDQLRALLDRLLPRWATVRELCSKYGGEMSCVLYSYGEANPGFHISPDLLLRISDLQIDFDFDLYCLPGS